MTKLILSLACALVCTHGIADGQTPQQTPSTGKPAASAARKRAAQVGFQRRRVVKTARAPQAIVVAPMGELVFTSGQ
ncbi:MAG TPA: hypothetical protein VER76_18485, partial [Pyrinomonadaceae bacterium]|nr:hypothetical protein [Pyrinomonadaceae bacterium]